MDIMASILLTCIQTGNIKFSIHKDQICAMYLCVLHRKVLSIQHAQPSIKFSILNYNVRTLAYSKLEH
jgi:hypothetical protein